MIVPGLGKKFRCNQRTNTDRVGRIQPALETERRQKLVDLLLVGYIQDFQGMRQGKTINTDHHRQLALLGNTKCLYGGIHRFLVVGAVKLYPAGVAHRHGILLIVPDRQRRRYRAVGTGQYQWHTQSRDVEQHLTHQQDALRGRCRIGTRTRGHGAKRNRRCREFAFNAHQFAVEFTVCNQSGQIFNNMSLWCYRVGRYHLRPTQADRLGDSL